LKSFSLLSNYQNKKNKEKSSQEKILVSNSSCPPGVQSEWDLSFSNFIQDFKLGIQTEIGIENCWVSIDPHGESNMNQQENPKEVSDTFL
jgi:hypothetical protein